MSEFDVLVLGDANPDLVLRGGEVVPAFGQAERLVEEARLTIGGSGAIFACGAARLGLRVALVGVVGDDLFGRFMREEVEAAGVDARGLSVDMYHPTGVTVVLSKPDDRAMLTSAGTIGGLRGSLVDPELLRSSRHVHVSSYFLQSGLVADLPRLFREARAADATTSVDPNWDPSGVWDGGLPALMSSIDVFLPNRMEALQLARISSLEDAMARLRAAGSGMVVVKDGEEGAVGAQAGEIVVAPAVPVRAVDTTGAGDSFDAGFVAGFIAGEGLERCLALGNACGALSTRRVGGTGSQATMPEALETIDRGSVA